MVWVSKRVARCKLAGIDCRHEQSACDDLSLYVYSVRANVADSSQQMHKLYHNCYFDTHVTHSLYICAVSLTCRLACDFDMHDCKMGHCSIKPIAGGRSCHHLWTCAWQSGVPLGAGCSSLPLKWCQKCTGREQLLPPRPVHKTHQDSQQLAVTWLFGITYSALIGTTCGVRIWRVLCSIRYWWQWLCIKSIQRTAILCKAYPWQEPFYVLRHNFFSYPSVQSFLWQ